MSDRDELALPFVTRPMLEFEHGTTFSLRLTAYSNSTTNIEIRGFTKEGAFVLKTSHTGDLDVESTDFRLPDIPIMVSVTAQNDTIQKGDTYVRLHLVINGVRHIVLAQGYISKMQSITWPAISAGENLPNRGLMVSVAGTLPGAGNEVLITVPTNRAWILKGVALLLETDGTSANREVQLVIDDGTNVLFRINTFANVPANQLETFSFGDFSHVTNVDDRSNQQTGIVRDLLLPEGFRIGTATFALQAADDYTIFRLYVEQFITP